MRSLQPPQVGGASSECLARSTLGSSIYTAATTLSSSHAHPAARGGLAQPQGASAALKVQCGGAGEAGEVGGAGALPPGVHLFGLRKAFARAEWWMPQFWVARGSSDSTTTNISTTAAAPAARGGQHHEGPGSAGAGSAAGSAGSGREAATAASSWVAWAARVWQWVQEWWAARVAANTLVRGVRAS